MANKGSWSNDNSVTVVGVISDTHGSLSRAAARALAGVDHIIHAGDIVSGYVLPALRHIAPTAAVRGNMDGYGVSGDLPLSAAVEMDGMLFYVLHIVDRLDLDPRAAGIAAVVYGHTHRADIEWHDGVLYFNPGSAGPRRFDLPVTVGRLRVNGVEVQAEVVDLLSD